MKVNGALNAGMLPGLLGYRLRLAQRAVFRDFAASVAELSPGRVGILLLVDANPGVTQGRLAQAVNLERSTMVGVVDALEERGLIERRRGEDRRTNGLWLTRTGRSLVARLKRRIEAHERRVAQRLSPAEREQLIGLLEKLSA
jgi:DNA-binding MarR family transcriptional regulator